MIGRNPEVATQPLFFDKIEDVTYEKVLCVIYPNFSLYEITTLTSTLALSFDITIDYVASENSMVVSEDGLPCQPTKTFGSDPYRRLFLCDFVRNGKYRSCSTR